MEKQLLAEARERRGWTQAELAFHAGLSPSTIYLLEAGRKDPRWATVQSIANALGVSVESIDWDGPRRSRIAGRVDDGSTGKGTA